MASPKERLMALSREDLKKAAKVLKLAGYGNKNKTQLVNMIMEASREVSKAQYEAEGAILKVREALGLSTHGKVKSRTQGIRKSFKDEAKSPKELASEALAAMRKAMAMAEGKPKLKRQFVARMKKEMDDFEKEVEEITSRQPAVAARKAASKRYKDSSQLIQEL
jgi:hypothetical protein